MESLKKYFKLLCCVFITLFVFGIGGEYVLAEPEVLNVVVPGNTPQEQSWYFEFVPTGGYQNSLIKKDQDGNYVFCLDSNQKLYRKGMNKVTDFSSFDSQYELGYKEKIGKVLAIASRLGLGNGRDTHTINIGNNSYTISEKDLYGVTQAAVWFAAHGEQAEGGYTQKYKSWVENNGYKVIFMELMKDYSISYILDKTAAAQPVDDSYFYSEEYTLRSDVALSNNSKYELKLDNYELINAASAVFEDSDIQVRINDGDWVDLTDTAIEIPAGAKIIIRADRAIVSSYSFSITANYKNYSSDVFIYSAPSDYQNIVLGIPTSKKLTDRKSIVNPQPENPEPEKEKIKVKFRKVDANGEAIQGVEIKIFNYVKSSVSHNTNEPFLCAISDESGYLSKPCSNANIDLKNCVLVEDNKCKNGEYYLEPSDEESGNMYYIQENFKDGYYVQAFDPNDEDHATTQDFYISDKVFFAEYSAKNYVKLIGNLGAEVSPTINIINDRYLKFSKIDTGTGAEVPGAKMVLYDASVTDTGLSENPLFVMVDEWTSTDKPHIFTGIIPGHEYLLSEEAAPDNFVKLKTDIRFKMDANGNIEVLTVDQDLVKPKDDARNWLIIGNDAVPKKIDVPNTGISLLNKIAIGGLMVFVGYEAIKIYRKRTA